MWVFVIIVVLLVWGNLSRKSASHPLNAVRINPQMPVCAHRSTVGDNFNSGNAIAPGVTEECVGLPTPLVPVHVVFPINPPPPIAIQVPNPVLRSPSSVGIRPIVFSHDYPCDAIAGYNCCGIICRYRSL